jgi:hypothetical protein
MYALKDIIMYPADNKRPPLTVNTHDLWEPPGLDVLNLPTALRIR